MKKNEELLQRCFDSDLNDDEMESLFSEMSKDKTLRVQFRSLQKLQTELRSIPSPNVPATLDERITSTFVAPRTGMFPSRSAFQRIYRKKFTLSIPAFAATILLLLAGSYVAAKTIFIPKQKLEYIYVVEMPTYVVQSNYQIKTN